MTSEVLLEVAKQALFAAARAESYTPQLDEMPPDVCVPGKSFVTLTIEGRLRGCIGTLVTKEILVEDVATNALKASRDPRFAPVGISEVEQLEVEISILGTAEPLHVASYEQLLTVLGSKRDGLIVRAGQKRAVFLPVVWHSLREPVEFVAALWHKAGLAPGLWPHGVQLETFTTRSIGPTHISKI